MGQACIFLGCALTTLLWHGDVLAQEAVKAPVPSESQSSAREHAREHFDQGVTAYREGRFEVARASFEAALAVYRSPVFIFNLAKTYEKLGRPSRALAYYRDYQRLAPDAKDQAYVRERIESLETSLLTRGVQEVTIDTSPSGAKVSIDGEPRGTTPFVGELANGSHAVRFSLAEHADQEVSVETAGVEATELVYPMKPVQLAPPSPAPVPPPNEVGPGQRKPALVPPVSSHREVSASSRHVGTWTYVTLGASVAALGGAGVLELLRRNSEDDVRELTTQRERVNAYETMNDYQTAARIAAGVGLGLAVVGTTLLVIDLISDEGHGTPKMGSLIVGPGQLSLRGNW